MTSNGTPFRRAHINSFLMYFSIPVIVLFFAIELLMWTFYPTFLWYSFLRILPSWFLTFSKRIASAVYSSLRRIP